GICGEAYGVGVGLGGVAGVDGAGFAGDADFDVLFAVAGEGVLTDFDPGVGVGVGGCAPAVLGEVDGFFAVGVFNCDGDGGGVCGAGEGDVDVVIAGGFDGRGEACGADYAVGIGGGGWVDGGFA